MLQGRPTEGGSDSTGKIYFAGAIASTMWKAYRVGSLMDNAPYLNKAGNSETRIGFCCKLGGGIDTR